MSNERISKEAAIAAKSKSSSAPLILLEGYIEFPSELERKVILDICGGASSATHELRAKGARAVAVDYKYTDPKKLKKELDLAQTKFQQQRSSSYISLESELVAITKQLGLEDVESVLGPDHKTRLKMARNARKQFTNDIEINQGFYISALAGNLPFKDNSFDFCFSSDGLTVYAIDDEETFLGCVSEALRVLKPSCELQLSPWKESDWDSKWLGNADSLLQNLKSSGHSFTLEDNDADGRLRITKS